MVKFLAMMVKLRKITLEQIPEMYIVDVEKELENTNCEVITIPNSDQDISKLNFNDIILIKNTRYRIYKIEYRADAMSKLELITLRNL
jgi:hypothetical protein